MKKIRNIVSAILLLVGVGLVSSYTINNKSSKILVEKESQMINLFVTHGHCSTPFAGEVNKLNVNIPVRKDLGNPLENMSISFEVNPNTFNVCSGEELTARIKTPGLFINEKNENFVFNSTNVYTMGMDWYQINGKLSIKGIEKDVKLFATGIKESQNGETTMLVLEGQMNLLDWGIDYDKIVNGTSDSVPTEWMYLNMKIEL